MNDYELMCEKCKEKGKCEFEHDSSLDNEEIIQMHRGVIRCRKTLHFIENAFNDAFIDKNIYCNKCNKVMKEGYSIHDGLYHYCSDKCLNTEFTEEEYKELHEQGYGFWTIYED